MHTRNSNSECSPSVLKGVHAPGDALGKSMSRHLQAVTYAMNMIKHTAERFDTHKMAACECS